MGHGDDVMWLGEAYIVHKKTGKKIRPVKGGKTTRRSAKPMCFEGIPWLSTNEGGPDVIDFEIRPNQIDAPTYDKNGNVNGRKLQQLRQYEGVDSYEPKKFNEIVFNGQEKAATKELQKKFGDRNYIIFNPDPKKTKFRQNNKDWGWQKWVDLSAMLSVQYNIVRCYHGKGGELPNAYNIRTHNAKAAARAVINAKAVITTEGLMHHICGSYNIPCVVIYGGVTGPSHFGYEGQENLVYDHPMTPCNTKYKDCPHCREAMDSISINDVAESLERALNT